MLPTRFYATLLPVLSLLTLGPGSAAAQTGTGDAGGFRVTVGGKLVGTEEFTIRQTGSGANSEIVANGGVQLTLASGSLVLTTRLRARGLGASPVSYQVDVGGDSPRKIVATIGEGRFSARIASPAGEQLREYVVSSGAVVLDEGIAHHYHFVARATGERVPIVIPRENRQVMATVSRKVEERREIAGSTHTLYRFVVTPDGGEDRHVWVDALNRVYRVEIPDRDYVAERMRGPG